MKPTPKIQKLWLDEALSKQREQDIKKFEKIIDEWYKEYRGEYPEDSSVIKRLKQKLRGLK